MTNFYSRENHGDFELINIGRLDLEEGGVIEDCQLAVAVHGNLNQAKDNAILIPTWYSGTSGIMGEAYVGEGRALDPSRYCIIVVNQIGNGLSTSPSNAPAPIAGANFPKVRITDDVQAQHRLLTEYFGIHQLQLVVGGSMGAQQTYEWAVRYPDMVLRAAPIAGTACNTEHDFLFTDTLVEAITTDPAFAQGQYKHAAEVSAGLARHAKLWTVMGWSTEFFRAGRHRAMGFADINAFVTEFMTGYFSPMDPNNLLCMAWKWQRGDVSRLTAGDLAAALGRITAQTFIMPISHDMFFPPNDCLAEQQLIAGSEFHPLSSIDGHLGLFGTDDNLMAELDTKLSDLLSRPVC